MKYLVLLGDGMADFPVESLGDRTPLAVADTPAMDEAVSQGISGLFCPIPDSLPAGSDVGNLSMFGYDPLHTYTGRAPLEAANQGITIGANELVFRCNLVTLDKGRMKDFTADHISTEEAAELIEALNRSLGDAGVKFHAGVSYRHLCVITADPDLLSDLESAECTPPHDIIDKDYSRYMPKGSSSARLHALMNESSDILINHPVNRARIAAGKRSATSIWLWGQGGSPKMATYSERFGLDGAVISAVDLVNGIGRCAGLEVVSVPGVTGYLDTNYEGKVAAGIDALARVDFVYIHIEAPDEAAHEGRPDLKVKAIEDFDRLVVQPCMAHASERGDCRVLIAPDHITSLATRTHAGGPVPFILTGPGVTPNELHCYSEEEASRAGVLYPNGFELVTDMLTREEISFGRVQ